MNDEKIFIYLRFRDEKETVLKSRIREFAAISKLMTNFLRQIWEKCGLHILQIGTLEYVDANSDMVLISFKKDVIRQQIIISGLIPKQYQKRMLNKEEAKIKFSVDEIAQQVAPNADLLQQAIIRQRLEKTPWNILDLINENIDENGEFYIVLDLNRPVYPE